MSKEILRLHKGKQMKYQLPMVWAEPSRVDRETETEVQAGQRQPWEGGGAGLLHRLGERGKVLCGRRETRIRETETGACRASKAPNAQTRPRPPESGMLAGRTRRAVRSAPGRVSGSVRERQIMSLSERGSGSWTGLMHVMRRAREDPQVQIGIGSVCEGGRRSGSVSVTGNDSTMVEDEILVRGTEMRCGGETLRMRVGSEE